VRVVLLEVYLEPLLPQNYLREEAEVEEEVILNDSPLMGI
jgi:hypothetical protein